MQQPTLAAEKETIDTPSAQPMLAKFGENRLKSKFSISPQNPTTESDREDNEEFKSKASDDFSIDQLRSKWHSYCSLLTKEGKHSLAATLTKNPFTLNDKIIITLVVDNRIQQMDLDINKQQLLNYLRQELNNYSIDIKIEVNETVSDIQHLTNKDKFTKMAEKNPFLNQFKDHLDLELEY